MTIHPSISTSKPNQVFQLQSLYMVLSRLVRNGMRNLPISSSLDDMRMPWAHGTSNLKLGVFHLSQWTKDFNPFTHHQNHAQIWIRLMDLLREYWREKILREIPGVRGTPLIIDSVTQNRHFGHFARVLVDMIYRSVFLIKFW